MVTSSQPLSIFTLLVDFQLRYIQKGEQMGQVCIQKGEKMGQVRRQKPKGMGLKSLRREVTPVVVILDYVEKNYIGRM